MTREEVLKVEFEQQYEQYRWIGRQQTLVFTFYAAIVAATFALIGAFSEEGAYIQLYPWFFGVLLFLGIVGIVVSFALIKSRGMQFRIAIYIVELLIQMTENSATTSTPSLAAVRFKAITTTGGFFSPRDTATIAIALVFVFGTALIFGSFAVIMTTQFCFDKLEVSILWLIAVIIVSCLGISYILPKKIEKENEDAIKDHECLKGVTNWAEDLRNRFKLKK